MFENNINIIAPAGGRLSPTNSVYTHTYSTIIHSTCMHTYITCIIHSCNTVESRFTMALATLFTHFAYTHTYSTYMNPVRKVPSHSCIHTYPYRWAVRRRMCPYTATMDTYTNPIFNWMTTITSSRTALPVHTLPQAVESLKIAMHPLTTKALKALQCRKTPRTWKQILRM